MGKIDFILKAILVIILFAVPIAITAVIWFTPGLDTNKVLVGVSTINVILSIAEVMFLVRAAIFPKHGKKWWQNW